MAVDTIGHRGTGASRRTRLFQNGNSQAVRIPKAFAFASVDVEVEIERRGEELIVRPTKRRLSGLGAAFRALRPRFQDFRRGQPVQDERDWPAPDVPSRDSHKRRHAGALRGPEPEEYQ